jgi:hypothetical protein
MCTYVSKCKNDKFKKIKKWVGIYLAIDKNGKRKWIRGDPRWLPEHSHRPSDLCDPGTLTRSWRLAWMR